MQVRFLLRILIKKHNSPAYISLCQCHTGNSPLKDICLKCRQPKSNPDGTDRCLGLLPGVLFACCGHGKGRAYIMLDYTDPQGMTSSNSALYGPKATLRVSSPVTGRILIPPGESSSSGLYISEEDFALVVLKLRGGVSPKDALEGLIEKYGLRKKIG